MFILLICSRLIEYLFDFGIDIAENLKHHRDPMCTQHRYEDLLEGAISLYSIETTEYHTIETITKEEFPEILIGKDMRGKSAEIFTT